MRYAVVSVALCLASCASAPKPQRPAREFRVCADPNNLPFSNDRGEGFENKLAELLAKDLGAKVTYTWFPQRRGFIRETLKANRCDVIMGVPTALDMVATTAPYYRSSYVFVYGPSAPHVQSLNAPELKSLRIGVPLVGDDGASPPPVIALGQRGLINNLHGYTVYGDYSKDSPPADLIRAVAKGEVDLAVAWGPLAGYFTQHVQPTLALAPIPEAEAPFGQPFQFDISLGVRRSDKALKAELDEALVRNRAPIAALLAQYGVPVVAAH